MDCSRIRGMTSPNRYVRYGLPFFSDSHDYRTRITVPSIQPSSTAVDSHSMGKSLLPTGFVRPLSQNRRRGRRHPLDIPATLIGGPNPKAERAVKIVEFSKHGLGMRASEPFSPGEIYTVRAFDTLIPPGTQVRIVSNRSLPNRGFIIGSEVV